MSAESPRHVRGGGPLTVPSQPPSDRSIIDAVSGFINDVTLSSGTAQDPKDVIQWARFETADINEPTPEGDSDSDISPLLLILGYGSGVQVWLIPPSGDAQEVLSWRQGTVKVLRILPSPQHGDCFASKRPLIALCDSASTGPTFCSLSFISIRGGEQVKSIKFKNPILDVLANKRSVVVSFSERFAVFDAATLEDRMTVTTCYPCPCPLGGSAPINPLALGDRWLAYADKKLNQSKRSSGGCEGEGVTSYTATVLHAAKSLSKGLRGLGESVAQSLGGGGRSTSQSPSPPNADIQQPGVVTILDIEGNDDEDFQDSEEPYEPMVAHFVAHSEAVIALCFDASGLLLVTADRRGHDFHVFRINPHPCGPSLAAVHHLYVLHRGDTTAKVQDIAISWDSRWAAISTLRGTTHVFAISAYGGAPSVRTHTQPRVVNRLSRFHRSAGLPITHHTQATPKRNTASPVSEGLTHGSWFPNPRLPPYPVPVTLQPLAQLRPTANLPTHTLTRTSSGRQRLSSLSEDSNAAPLLARCSFGMYVGTSATPVTALYLMAANGSLLHLVLHPRANHSIPKEKVCDESPIEVEVEAAAQWPLQRPAGGCADLLAPLPPANPLLQPAAAAGCADMCMSEEERWLSQVEIVTHAGPHRRLWMGPQFVFKTYNCTGSNSSLSEAETVDVELHNVARSNPVNVPAARPIVPVLIDSGSCSSLEQSPSDGFRRRSVAEGRAPACDLQLREDLAEAMREDHGRERTPSPPRASPARAGVARAVDPLGCVVARPARRAPPPLEPDAHTRANPDEARFRPVVRAPAALAPAAVLARPLPRGTTIPAQSCAPAASPELEPARPLATHVLIPAALHHQPPLPAGPPGSASPPTDADDGDRVSCKARDKDFDVCERVHVTDVKVKFDVAVEVKCDVAREIDLSSVSKETTELKMTKESNVRQSTSKDNRKSSVAREIKKSNVVEETTEYNVKKENRDFKISSKNKESDIGVVISESNPPMAEKEDENVREPSITQKSERSSVAREIKMSNVEDVKKPKGKEVRSTSATRETEKSNEPKKTKDLKQSFKSDDSKSSLSRAEESKKVREPSVIKAGSNSSVTKDDGKSRAEVIETSQVRSSSVTRATRKSSDPKETKDSENLLKSKDFKELTKETSLIKESKQPKEAKRSRDVQESKQTKEPKNKAFIPVNEPDDKIDTKTSDEKESTNLKKEPEMFTLPIKAVSTQSKCRDWRDGDIKTEEQAWDLLLNEPEKPVVAEVSQQPVDSDKISIESKPKSKRNRKNKKAQEDLQAKVDEDSFVEIHAIEDKQQPCSGDLVSISTYEAIEPSCSYRSKTNKIRSPIIPVPEKCETREEGSAASKKDELQSVEDCMLKEAKTMESFVPRGEFFNKMRQSKSESREDHICDSNSLLPTKANKSKSLSPYKDDRKAVDRISEVEVKDVYVIDTSKDDFPEIQITRGKSRKRSPQPKPAERQTATEVPVKSWSSIAASKNVKKIEVEGNADDIMVKRDSVCLRDELRDAAGLAEDNTEPPTVSLQEKLVELCKRTDIMVAECDAPSELNFVEEHHAVMEDLPPLEPLDFGLEDFKLEVMRDSLLDVNDPKMTSPICKINIDDILSSIKETTNKVIESSTFNLIDLEKVPAKKEKGFSVIESHKITSQEVNIEDDGKSEEKDVEVMEKSSDDDTVSAVVSTDSDKEDKKTVVANVVLPSAKQSTKSKKSRRKKK
ncbi:uncharacterized protein LOC106134548 [Amyelois transitella]|uniref:uncharacterized protein LOC106134548 n=1 Tax=Amyelois transitella TaxID=680683 RepID=UPI00298F781F|nr:uncharacterized protein LOC106134548 [Amyelois transitella]